MLVSDEKDNDNQIIIWGKYEENSALNKYGHK